LAVAAALGLLVLVAGAFVWDGYRQATDRKRDEQVRLGRNAEAVTALLEQCEEALQAEQPDRAAVAHGAAERRAADGGAEGLAERLGRCRADLGLFRALDDIDTFSWTWTEDDRAPDPKTLAARWRAAFGDYGVSPDDEPAAAAERVNGSLVRDRALTALDEWLAVEPSPWVREVLRSADPDPYRDAVRDALAAQDRSTAVTLAARPDALVQPARFAAVLGQVRGLQPDRQRAVLESALQARPGALRLLMAMGLTYSTESRLGPREQVRWFQAAAAAHPGNVPALNNLGIALWKSGNRDGSIFYFKETIRLEPTFARGHYNLGVALRSKEDMHGARAAYRDAIRVKPDYVAAYFDLGLVSPTTDEAIAAYREVIRIDPKHKAGTFNLGWNLRRKGDPDGALVAFRNAVQIDPKYAAAQYELARLLASGPDRLRHGKQAVEHATRACELTKWNEPIFIATLAAAHAEDRDFDKAIEYQTKALGFPALKNAGPEWCQERLDLYVRKKPYRDPAFTPREAGPPPREVMQ
jgi:tetratricopeptide (TPR) repeat protein